MTYKDVIRRFVNQYWNPDLKDLRAGNYVCMGGCLYLFGNKIAFHTPNGIDSNYRGPYSGSRTTNKALRALRNIYNSASRERRQSMLFVNTRVWMRKSVASEWEEELPELDDDKIGDIKC